MDADKMAMNDHVLVGIPCFNRPDGLADTLRCLLSQTHRNWTAVVCDNASPDPRIGQIARQAAADDSRICYHRHGANLGAFANFRFAAHCGEAEFFMWASDDDLWHPEFMAENLRQLGRCPEAQLSFGSVNIINSSGEKLFALHNFSRLRSQGDRFEDVRRYLEDPEKLGKANLFYSLFRTAALRSCIATCWDDACSRHYAADLVFLFAFVCRHPIVCHDELHLFKRQPTSARRKIRWRHPRSYRVIKANELESYIQRHRLVAPQGDLADLAESILRRRQAERFLYLVPGLNRLLPQ